MITLFIDTSTTVTGIAVTGKGQLLAESSSHTAGRRQNIWLLPEIKHVLAFHGLTVQEIDLFSCTTGPGSFTGIRTGVATVQGLALSSGKPCIGISSLALLAMNIPNSPYPVCPLLDARKKEVYAGLYNCSTLPSELHPDQVLAPEKLLASLSGPTIFVGDGAYKYQEQIISEMGADAHFAPVAQNIPRPVNGAILAAEAYSKGNTINPQSLLPTYLRLSEAELSRQNLV